MVSLLFFFFHLVRARFRPNLVLDFSKFLQLHELSCFSPQLVEVDNQFFAQVVGEWFRAKGCSHVMQGLRLSLLNLFMNNLKDSPFPFLILTRVREVMWCGWLVLNCIPNRPTNVSKLLMECRGSQVNKLNITPFNDVGNTRQKMMLSIVYKLI